MRRIDLLADLLLKALARAPAEEKPPAEDQPETVEPPPVATKKPARKPRTKTKKEPK